VAGTSPVDQLAKLNDLRQQGAISQEEFDRLKPSSSPDPALRS
jgi:hypothetical protein